MSEKALGRPPHLDGETAGRFPAVDVVGYKKSLTSFQWRVSADVVVRVPVLHEVFTSGCKAVQLF